jgi:hypothetical protein
MPTSYALYIYRGALKTMAIAQVQSVSHTVHVGGNLQPGGGMHPPNPSLE